MSSDLETPATGAGSAAPDQVGVLTRRTAPWVMDRPDGPAPRSEWLHDGVLVIGDSDGQIAAEAADLPSLPDEVTVVSVLNHDEDWWWLADAVAFAAPPGTAVRLAISHGGRPLGEESPPAEVLARRLKVDVVAPDGPLLLVPGGSAFVAEPDPSAPARLGMWLRFHPDGSVEGASGPRHPVPPWGAAVDYLTGQAGPIRIATVPSGLWIYRGTEAASLADLAYCAPAVPHEVLLIIGAPGTEPPEPEQVASVVDRLPPDVAAHVVLAPHAGAQGAILPVARELAVRWEREILVLTGLPLIGADSVRSVVSVDDAGQPTWRPLIPRLAVGAGDPPPRRLPYPDDPVILPGQVPAADDFYPLTDPWTAEVTWFGLWLHRRDRSRVQPVLPDAHWTSGRLDVVVDGSADDEVVAAIVTELLQILAPEAREHVRIRYRDLAAPHQPC